MAVWGVIREFQGYFWHSVRESAKKNQPGYCARVQKK